MKRNILILITLLISINLYAQKFELIKELKFDDFLQYYEEYPDDDGYNRPGLGKIFIYNSKIYANNFFNGEWIYCTEEGYKKNFNEKAGYSLQGSNILFKKLYNKSLFIFINGKEIDNPNYSIKIIEDFYYKSANSIYLTENIVFAQTNDDKLVSWTLLEDGKSEYHGKEETQKMLDEGLAEKFGFHTNSRGSTKYFGEFNMTNPSFPNSEKIWQKLYFKTPGYENFENLQSFNYIGTEKNGYGLYWRTKYNGKTSAIRDPDTPITVLIAVLDPWTRDVNVIELLAGDWNPARNENGLIASCSQCIDEEGNIYFTDCSKEKGCYEIKKLSNDWIKQYDFYNREIGRMNTNHIPLQKEANSSAENNGFNFEHEYLWVLEHGNEWCKVRKVDGREGWVESKYINFN